MSLLSLLSDPVKIWSYNLEDSAWDHRETMEYYLLNRGMWLKIVPGLMGIPGTISFQSTDEPTQYLRHYNDLMDMEDRTTGRSPESFPADATFYVHKNYFYLDYEAYESYNKPGYFIRHENYRLKISPYDGTEQFKGDATFQPRKQQIVRFSDMRIRMNYGRFK